MAEDIRRILLISDDNRFNRQVDKKLTNDNRYIFNLSIFDSINKIESHSGEFDLIVIHNKKYLPDSVIDYIKSQTDKPIILSGRFRDHLDGSLFKNTNVLLYPKGILSIPVLMGIIHTLMVDNQKEDELQRREDILEIVNYAAEKFLIEPDWFPFINGILARLGQVTNSDRVFILKLNSEKPELKKTEIFSEWAL